MKVMYQSSDWAVNNNCILAQEERCRGIGRLRIRASEPVAAIGHPPAKDADGNGGQQRPYDGQGEIRNKSKHHKSSPEDLALHFLILPRAIALSSPEKQTVSMKNHMPSAQPLTRSRWD